MENDEPDVPQRPWSAYKKRILAVFVLLSGLLLAYETFLQEANRSTVGALLLEALVSVVCVPLWVSFDSAERRIELARGYRLLVILIPVIGFPLYAFRSRGVRGFGLIALALLVSLLASVVGTGLYLLGRMV